MEWISGIVASVIGFLTGSFLTWHIAGKRIYIENITQERTKWRKKVRDKALLIHDAMIKGSEEEINRHRNELRLLLNPKKCEDLAIIQSIKLPRHGSELEQAEEVAKRIAALLKNDWERSKHETKAFSSIRRQPKPLTYACLLELERRYLKSLESPSNTT